MDCRTIQDRLVDQPDILWSESPDGEVARHLSTCRECREFARNLNQIMVAIESIDPPVLTQDRKSRMHEYIKAGHRDTGKWFRVPAYAAMAAIFFLAGFGLKTMLIHPTATDDSQVRTTAMSCPALYYGDYPLDPGALYRWPDRTEGSVRISFPNHYPMIPEGLSSHGPYNLFSDQIMKSGTRACIPFVSPFGHVIVLYLEKAPPGGRSESGFLVNSDPSKVLFNRITWNAEGWVWTIEGRAPPDYLFDLADEMNRKLEL